MRKKTFLFCVAVLLATTQSLFAQSQPPTVSGVSAVVDTLQSIVSFTFDLQDVESDSMEVSLRLSSDNGETYLLNPDSLSGDAGFPVFAGSGKTILWHYEQSTFNLNQQSLVAKVIADDRKPVDIQNIVSQVDSMRLRNDLTFLAKTRHRTAGPVHLEAVKDTLENRFSAVGLQSYRQEWQLGSYQAANIIGRLPGRPDEATTFIIDAHFDSQTNTPGADDNASGVAGVLEAARILSAYSFRRSIRFIGFDLEEAGLIGAGNYVANGIPSYEETAGVFNFEMIGFYCDIPGCQSLPNGFDILFPAAADSVAANDFRGDFITNVANEASNSLRFAFDSLAAEYVPELRVISLAVPGNGQIAPDLRRSDHAQFWDAGYKALMLTDGSEFRNPNYHQPGDSIATLDLRFMTNVVKATIATVADLAGLQNSGTGISNSFEVPITGINHVDQQEISGFELLQNYPNPFNPTTTIRYELLRQGLVTLEVQNTLGERVRLLLNSEQVAGEYTAQWNGLSDAGLPVSSGLYFYRLTLNGESHTSSKSSKMLLIR
ncbi:MAG: M28 family peptidase [Calditrichia bacterium]